MKVNESKSPKAQQDDRYLKACSAQDCTGLIPSGPIDEAELLHYAELYPFFPKVPTDPVKEDG